MRISNLVVIFHFKSFQHHICGESFLLEQRVLWTLTDRKETAAGSCGHQQVDGGQRNTSLFHGPHCYDQPSRWKLCRRPMPSTQIRLPAKSTYEKLSELSYRRGTARRAVFVNLCWVSRGTTARKVSNSKSDL